MRRSTPRSDQCQVSPRSDVRKRMPYVSSHVVEAKSRSRDGEDIVGTMLARSASGRHRKPSNENRPCSVPTCRTRSGPYASDRKFVLSYNPSWMPPQVFPPSVELTTLPDG